MGSGRFFVKKEYVSCTNDTYYLASAPRNFPRNTMSVWFPFNGSNFSSSRVGPHGIVCSLAYTGQTDQIPVFLPHEERVFPQPSYCIYF